jgi:hypothetical protein
MAMIRIGPCGKIGVNRDLSSHELPPEAWTDARNIRFLDGMAYQFYGHGAVYDPPTILPYHVLPVNVGAERHWLYAGAAKVYDVTSASGTAVHTNITRQTASVDVDYTATPNAWTSTSLSGIPVLNNGVDVPQQWGLTGKLTALTAWDANWRAKSIRAFKNQLIALNVTKSGTNYPFMVKWSHPAVPGAVPASWDETDATLDAGETDIAEGGDPIMDGLQLGGTFMIYKEQSLWRMDYTGGPFVNAFTKVLGTSGAMNRNCVVEIDGFHVVLTGSDVIVHDGQSATSVLDKQTRRALFQMVDAQAMARCFVFKNPFVNEVFVCFPEAGATVPNLALVWNYKDRTVTFREIPNLHHANYGPVESGLAQPWDTDAAPWASDITSWNAAEFTPDTARVLMASADTKLHLLDSSTTFNGTLPVAYMERRGLSLGAPDRMKLVRGIRPRIKGNTGETVLISVGSAADPYDEPTYGTAQAFTIGSSVAIDCLVESRYPAVKFASGDAYQWRLDSYDIDVVPAGEY